MRASASRRGYGTRWQEYRRRYLEAHPHCVRCRAAGRLVRATVINHVRAHKGDHKRFWDPKNHEAVCTHCHSSDIQRYEKTGKAQYRGCDASGTPLDPDHNWHKQPLTP